MDRAAAISAREKIHTLKLVHSFVALILSLYAAGAAAFSHEDVIEQARLLAASSHIKPARVGQTLLDLDYATYSAIRFNREQALWRDATRFEVELLPPGAFYPTGVDVSIVENGKARPVDFSSELFLTADETVAAALVREARISGFRLNYPIDSAQNKDEFLVFQGASYFQARSAGQTYGLSGRGLAINVAEAGGEELPRFRHFWIERPSADKNSVQVHALLDSPSVTGAYRFRIYPGARTTLDVDVTLFARREVRHVGLAPLTSMYLFGPVDRSSTPDYRPAVHDSEYLLIHNGRDEWLLRPLTNPRRLQLSMFADHAPHGFGLVQRHRDFAHYQDLEARFHRRPSAWVEPRGDWGKGSVTLVEIPGDGETRDNIIAYWRPAEALQQGQESRFQYRLTWPDRTVPGTRGALIERVAKSRSGGSGLPQLVVDYGQVGQEAGLVRLQASISQGRIEEVRLVDHPETGGWRAFVTFDPEGAEVAELRAVPLLEGKTVGEVLLYRHEGS